MAIEYGFELGGPATAGQVAGILADAAASLADGEPGGPSLHLRSGVRVVTTGSTPPPFPDPVEEEFGFAPAVHVLFRFDKFTDPLVQREDMTRLVAALLRALPADAVLTFESEIVWLLRRNGQLTISERGDFWTPDMVALLPQHDRASLPTL
jgi:hypothetical protein